MSSGISVNYAMIYIRDHSRIATSCRIGERCDDLQP